MREKIDCFFLYFIVLSACVTSDNKTSQKYTIQNVCVTNKERRWNPINTIKWTFFMFVWWFVDAFFFIVLKVTRFSLLIVAFISLTIMIKKILYFSSRKQHKIRICLSTFNSFFLSFFVALSSFQYNKKISRNFSFIPHLNLRQF